MIDTLAIWFVRLAGMLVMLGACSSEPQVCAPDTWVSCTDCDASAPGNKYCLGGVKWSQCYCPGLPHGDD